MELFQLMVRYGMFVQLRLILATQMERHRRHMFDFGFIETSPL